MTEKHDKETTNKIQPTQNQSNGNKTTISKLCHKTTKKRTKYPKAQRKNTPIFENSQNNT